jgi:hypothetical protein
MATEILAVPEEDLREVIAILREGMLSHPTSDHIGEYLNEWCDSEEAYLDALAEEAE